MKLDETVPNSFRWLGRNFLHPTFYWRTMIRECWLLLPRNASAHGVRAVILHESPNGREKAIVNVTRILTPTEKCYGQIEKEALSIFFAVRRFHKTVLYHTNWSQTIAGSFWVKVWDTSAFCKSITTLGSNFVRIWLQYTVQVEWGFWSSGCPISTYKHLSYDQWRASDRRY